MQDYHTVQGTVKPDGKPKRDAVLTYRQYLNDAFFYALLEGERTFLEEIADGPEKKTGLRNLVWGVWLGRKACIPSVPVLVGIFDSITDIENRLLGKNLLEAFTHLQEVDAFEGGIDFCRDQAASFESTSRQFNPRRVILKEAKSG